MRLRLPPLLVCALAAASCDNSQGARDGGRDAGDAASDAGRDAGSDGGRDAGRDAVVPPAAWQRVEGLPEVCDIEVARQPGVAIAPFEFEPCPGLERCRQVVVDWPDHPTRQRFALQTNHYVDGERMLLAYGRAFQQGGRDFNYYAVVTASGDHLGVVRSPHPRDFEAELCAVSHIAATADGYTFVAWHRTRAPASLNSAYVLRASYAAPSDVERLWRGAGPTTPAFVQSIEVSASVVGMFTPFPIEVLRVDATGETVTVCPAEPGAPYCKLDEVVGGSLLSSHDQGGWWVAIASPGDTRFRPLIDLPDSDDASPRSDGTDLVWMRGFDPVWSQPTRFELWASPYAETPAGLVPRRIAGITASGLNEAVGVGNGRAWTGERVDLTSEEFYYAIHNLEGGERRTYRFSAGEGPGLAGPMLGRDEVAIPIHPAPPGNYLETQTVRFIPYDALPVEPAPE